MAEIIYDYPIQQNLPGVFVRAGDTIVISILGSDDAKLAKSYNLGKPTGDSERPWQVNDGGMIGHSVIGFIVGFGPLGCIIDGNAKEERLTTINLLQVITGEPVEELD